MPTVRGQIVQLDTAAQQNIRVEITLVGANALPVEGYETATKKWITGTLVLFTDSTGLYTWSNAVANANITPSGTVYKRVAYVAGDTEVKYLAVPTGVGPHDEPNILTSAPSSIPPTELAAHIADSGAHGGVGGTTNHGSLTNVTSDQHHTQVHSISGGDHSGTLTHAALSSVTADQHHTQVHAIGGADHSGTLVHATQHNPAGADPFAQTVLLSTMQFKGTLVNGSGTSRDPIPFACTITFVVVALTTPSGSGTVELDLRLSTTPEGTATTVYTTVANRPKVTQGNHQVIAATPDITAVAANSYLVGDIIAAGSGAAGAVLKVYGTRP